MLEFIRFVSLMFVKLLPCNTTKRIQAYPSVSKSYFMLKYTDQQHVEALTQHLSISASQHLVNHGNC